jgi:hypothetical protein
MAPPPAGTEEDTFEAVCLSVWEGLNNAVRELGWIADGIGDASTTFSDRSLANVKRLELQEQINDVQRKYTAYKAKKLSIKPPSMKQMTEAARISAELASWSKVNVTVTAVLTAATDLLNIYNDSIKPEA